MNRQRVIALALIVLVATGLTAGSVNATGRSEKVDDLALELVGQVTNSPAGVSPATSIQYGYVTYLRGLPIFKAEPHSESTALFTFYVDTTTVRVINNGPLRVLSRTGTMTIYSDPSANGSFANPDSFRDGTPILAAGLRQHVIIDTLTGVFSTLNVNTIISSARFSGGSKTLRLGEKGGTFKTILSGHVNASPPPNGHFAGYTFGVGKPSET